MRNKKKGVASLYLMLNLAIGMILIVATMQSIKYNHINSINNQKYLQTIKSADSKISDVYNILSGYAKTSSDSQIFLENIISAISSSESNSILRFIEIDTKDRIIFRYNEIYYKIDMQVYYDDSTNKLAINSLKISIRQV